MYFLFHLPVFRKLIRQIFPIFISGDGNFNIYGQLFNSLLFGVIFYLLIKLINGASDYHLTVFFDIEHYFHFE